LYQKRWRFYVWRFGFKIFNPNYAIGAMMNTSYLISIAYFGFNDTMNTLIQTAYDLIESFDSEVGEQNGSYWRVATKLYGSVYIEG